MGSERDSVCNLHRRSGERSWAVCYYIAVCGRRCHLLQFPEHGHHGTPASGRYLPFVSVRSGEWFYVLPRQNHMFTIHVPEVFAS
jgi:hypothetical protein